MLEHKETLLTLHPTALPGKVAIFGEGVKEYRRVMRVVCQNRTKGAIGTDALSISGAKVDESYPEVHVL